MCEPIVDYFLYMTSLCFPYFINLWNVMMYVKGLSKTSLKMKIWVTSRGAPQSWQSYASAIDDLRVKVRVSGKIILSVDQRRRLTNCRSTHGLWSSCQLMLFFIKFISLFLFPFCLGHVTIYRVCKPSYWGLTLLFTFNYLYSLWEFTWKLWQFDFENLVYKIFAFKFN